MNDLLPILKARLKTLGWSRAELARRVGVPPVQITQWLNEARKPGMANLDAVIKAMGGLTIKGDALVWGDV